jgi:transcriptional regulator with GAF, ATPase, and Fis domain
MQHLTLDTYNLASAERRLCIEALSASGNIVGAAKLLGITRHSMKRRIIKLNIAWSREAGQIVDAQPVVTSTLGAHAA